MEGGPSQWSLTNETTRIELCDCQHSYEDLRSEKEKRKDVSLPPKLLDRQEWMWMEAMLMEEEEKGN